MRSIAVVSANGAADSDPDLVLYRNDGTQTTFDEGAGLSETTGSIPLAAGTHVIELYDYALTRGLDSDTNNGRRCFNLTIN